MARRARPVLDPGPQRVTDRFSQPVQAGPGGLGAEHRVEALLGPAKSTLGSTADLPGDRLYQPGQVGGGRDGEQRDAGLADDVHRGHGGPPLLSGEGGDPVPRRGT
jgi:hypothetical protein